jgi:hypothetical protein
MVILSLFHATITSNLQYATMKILRYAYRTKNLAKQGVYLLVTVLILLPAGRFFIPSFQVTHPIRQILSLDGYALKYDDNPAVSLFFRSIKSNHGYLCLGTSESDDLPNGNYWNFLNCDNTLKCKFSFLAGAGRTCGLYIPLFFRHRKEVDSLKIIYFINPVYWRTDLAKVNLEYWNRYSNYKVCSDLELSETEEKNYYPPVQDYLEKLNVFQKIVFSTEYEIRKSRKSFFQDLTHIFNPAAYEKAFAFIPQNTPFLYSFSNFGKIDSKNIDTTFNILSSFHDKQWFKPIDESSTYRYKELTSFISTCRDLGINATFILGPYNARFITNYNKASLAAYAQTEERIKQLLTNERVNFVDASDISSIVGAFNDHQHHSSYGAYLIYQKIKIEINEKKAR